MHGERDDITAPRAVPVAEEVGHEAGPEPQRAHGTPTPDSRALATGRDAPVAKAQGGGSGMIIGIAVGAVVVVVIVIVLLFVF
jgi:hypothetical protein